MVHNLLLEYFPELKRDLKLTHQKQWIKFLGGFSEICLWVHCKRSRHISGQGIVLFPKFWKQHFKNMNRWHFGVTEELIPYLVTDGHFDYKTGKSKCWIPTDDFLEKSFNFVSDHRFKSDSYWKSIVATLIRPEKTDIRISNIRIKSEIFNNIINHNIESNFILSTYQEDLLNGADLEYVITSSGRLQHPLQNIKSNTRDQLFPGWYNYDIKSCAPTILVQLFNQLEPHIHLPMLDIFIPNQSEIRNDISIRTGISVKEIKRSLTAMFFGLTIPSKAQSIWDINSSAKRTDFRFALINNLGPKSTQILLSDPQFSTIVEETKKIIKRLAMELQKTTIKTHEGWKITNSVGATKNLDRWNSKKAVAHIYFGHERKILDIVRSSLDHLGIKYLLIHDGWICDSPIDIHQLKKITFVKTGFNLAFTSEQLGEK